MKRVVIDAVMDGNFCDSFEVKVLSSDGTVLFHEVGSHDGLNEVLTGVLKGAYKREV